MSKAYTFDDVLIVPKFSFIESRKNVDLTSYLSSDVSLSLPVISANMDTITGTQMAITMAQNGGMGILHRFSPIEDNVKSFKSVLEASVSPSSVGVSIGLGQKEKERFEALYFAGARVFCLDVAHGAQMTVVEQVNYLKNWDDITLIVGNFATGQSIVEFDRLTGGCVHAYKVGIGGGSVCSTRIKTGVGYPQLSAIQDCVAVTSEHNLGCAIIADGGIKSPGDVAKALAAGADAVMIGGMFAGTTETPGDIVYPEGQQAQPIKTYRGSASLESYIDQGKVSDWRTAEGISTTVPHKGSVVDVLKDIEGGVRSAMTYVGANDRLEFFHKSEFIYVSSSTQLENSPHRTKW